MNKKSLAKKLSALAIAGALQLVAGAAGAQEHVSHGRFADVTLYRPAEEVKSVVTRFVLENNSFQGQPMFSSLMVTHTGDDVAMTGIMSENVPMSLVDELLWDALNLGADKAA